MDIRSEVEDILKGKGVPPPGMTKEQFFEKLHERIEKAVPLAVEKTITQIANEITREEMKQIGRGEPCKFLGEKSGKHCIKPANCHDCPNYKSARWQRLLRLPESLEFLIVALAVASLVLGIFIKEVSLFVLCLYFGVVLISRLHNYWLCRQLRKCLAR